MAWGFVYALVTVPCVPLGSSPYTKPMLVGFSGTDPMDPMIFAQQRLVRLLTCQLTTPRSKAMLAHRICGWMLSIGWSPSSRHLASCFAFFARFHPIVRVWHGTQPIHFYSSSRILDQAIRHPGSGLRLMIIRHQQAKQQYSYEYGTVL